MWTVHHEIKNCSRLLLNRLSPMRAIWDNAQKRDNYPGISSLVYLKVPGAFDGDICKKRVLHDIKSVP